MIKKIGLLISLSVLISGCAADSHVRRLDEMDMKVSTLETRLTAVEQRQALIASPSEESLEKGAQAKAGEINPKGIHLSKKDIQAALKNANFYNGPIDGDIGPKTKEAIREFQKANGLKADGIAGKETKQKLADYLKANH